MKIVLLALFLLVAGTQLTHAQAKLPSTAAGTIPSKEEQEILMSLTGIKIKTGFMN